MTVADRAAVTDILIVEDIWGPAFEDLRRRYRIDRRPDLWSDREALNEHAARSRALVVRNRTQVDADLLGRAPQLQVIARGGVGLDNIDITAADRSGIVVVAARGANARSVAEHTVALALSLARNVVALDRSTRAGGWQRTPGRELAGLTWGLFGAGSTGRAVAQLVAAWQLRVLGYDPHVAPDDPRVRAAGLELVALDRLLAESDVISIHVPATADTAGAVGRDFLRHMRPGALLINVGRGEVVDEAALAEALVDGRIGGAALDVRAGEPPRLGVLETLDRVVLTPHVAGLTHAAQDRVAALLVADLDAVLAGGRAQNAVGRWDRLRAADGDVR